MPGEWIRRPQGAAASAVFVHGILSSGETCWRNDNGSYWPELLKNEPELGSLGIYVFTYQTGIFSGSYRISDIVDALKEYMRLDDVLKSTHGRGLRAHRGAAARPLFDHGAWNTLLLSVVLYIVVPVIVAQLWRHMLLTKGGPAALARTLRALAPLSLSALLLTLVLLFGLQGEQIIRQPLVIALLAVPILIQVYFNAGLAYWLNRRLGVAWCVAGPSALIGASNFFELAVATAIALFGFQSGAALATVVGVLVEVPVMLSVVAIVNRSRGWYERALKPRGARAA